MYFFQRKGYEWSFFAVIFTYKRQLEGVWHFWFMTFFFVQTLWLHCLRACSLTEEKSEVTIGICQDPSTGGSLFIAFSGVLWTVLILFRFSLDQERIFSFTEVYSMYDKLPIFKVQFAELWHTSIAKIKTMNLSTCPQVCALIIHPPSSGNCWSAFHP